MSTSKLTTLSMDGKIPSDHSCFWAFVAILGASFLELFKQKLCQTKTYAQVCLSVACRAKGHHWSALNGTGKPPTRWQWDEHRFEGLSNPEYMNKYIYIYTTLEGHMQLPRQGGSQKDVFPNNELGGGGRVMGLRINCDSSKAATSLQQPTM